MASDARAPACGRKRSSALPRLSWQTLDTVIIAAIRTPLVPTSEGENAWAAIAQKPRPSTAVRPVLAITL